MVTIAQLERENQPQKTLPQIFPGDTVRVHVRITEGNKSRVQVYQGTVIALKNGGLRRTMTVRKVSNGVGVERIFPLYSAAVEQVEIKSRHRVRRAKLYYLRRLEGKRARLREVRDWQQKG